MAVILWPGLGDPAPEENVGTISLASLASALRLGTGSAPTGAVGTELNRLRAVAVALIDDLPLLDDTPVSLKNQAVVQVCGYWYDGPLNERGDPSALRMAGVLSLLRDYVKRGASSVVSQRFVRKVS